ncbi:MAG: helix-turn-helix domain-containing protein [Oscillospiraceae bacterium]|jgi:transcriptional regulator with XRE-family HTH domain
MNNKKIGQRIQKYREEANITQQTLAEITELSITSISNIERGLNYPTFENFIKIANAISVSTDLLLSDVIDAAYVAKASKLSEKLRDIPSTKRRQIFAVIEIMTILQDSDREE